MKPSSFDEKNEHVKRKSSEPIDAKDYTEFYVAVIGSVDAGKCLEEGTLVLMFDGTNKKVQDIKVGDLLMGDDSTPRKVLSTTQGYGALYKVNTANRDLEYVVNENHILVLNVQDKIVEISVKEFIKLSEEEQWIHKGIQTGIDFPEKKVCTNPYTFGSSYKKSVLCKRYRRDDQTLFIPEEYKYNSRQVRLELLAGLIDEVGYIFDNLICIDLYNYKMRDDISWLVRSLGFEAIQLHNTIITGLLRISITLNTSEVPLKKIKIVCPKPNMYHNISVGYHSQGQYYGFELDGNQRFVLGNFIVTHNSTSVGVLTNPGMLDDGRGKARASVFKHPHEHVTGRTSDISYQTYKDDEANPKRLITFVDLAGHEQYLKTTINGLSSGYPDMALVCISDKITKMTGEHLGLALNMNIPIVVIFTKIDITPPEKTAEMIALLKKKLKSTGRNFYHIRGVDDLAMIKQEKLIPFILTSNKTGAGVDLLKQAIRLYPKRDRVLLDGFCIDNIYYVQGHGIVVSGLAGQNIKKGDTLFLGPLHDDTFSEVKVKSLHNDYRFTVDELQKGNRGCVCIKLRDKDRRFIRPGIVLKHTIPENVCKRFVAEVKIFHHHTTIKPGYQAYANCGMIKESIKFIKIEDKKGIDINILRSGEDAIITMEFIKNLNYLEPGQSIIFREGTTRGIGKVIKVL